MYRFLIMLFIIAYIGYMLMVLLHCIGAIKLTYKKLDWKLIIPFYYWFNRINL